GALARERQASRRVLGQNQAAAHHQRPHLDYQNARTNHDTPKTGDGERPVVVRSLNPEVPFGERSSRAGLEVAFEPKRRRLVGKLEPPDNVPGSMANGVAARSVVVPVERSSTSLAMPT